MCLCVGEVAGVRWWGVGEGLSCCFHERQHCFHGLNEYALKVTITGFHENNMYFKSIWIV